MPLDIEILRNLTKCPANDAWRLILDETLRLASKLPAHEGALNDISQMDREIGVLDHFLSSVGWELWKEFGDVVQRTSERLKDWQCEPYNAKAILILDGLSLRELPLLLGGAKNHGFAQHKVSIHASELPGETNEFARAMGYSSRSKLQNNGAGHDDNAGQIHTESVDLPWKDCAALLDSTKNWIFWHHWPDSKIHDAAGAGQGLPSVVHDAETVFDGDEFWEFAGKLATGRRLVITSDHGYAFTGHFADMDGKAAQFMKENFAGQRNINGVGETGPYSPPVALQMDGINGPCLMALGRRKWRSQGGYPVLTHGGLSLLEVLSPFVELSKSEAAA